MFFPNEKQTLFHFETDLLRGVIHPRGHRHGIRKLIHKPTGLSLVHPDFPLLNLYLLFAAGRCLATARSTQRTVAADPTAVRINWYPTRAHRATLQVSYHLSAPNAIDLVIAAHAHDDYPAYEAMVANYFDLAFKPSIYVSGGQYQRAPHWFSPVLHHLYRDNALVFPRNAKTAQFHRDGRWANVRSIYRWKTQHYYALPIAMQIHPEQHIAVALMAHPETCASLSWTVGLADAKISSFGSDHFDNPRNARNPLYISLFGHDLEATGCHIARMRLSVIELDTNQMAPLDCYRAFIAEQKKPPA